MDLANAPVKDNTPGIRKRKWSPLKDESEDESFTGRSATEARENSATPGTPLGSDTYASHKRPRLQDISNSAEGEIIPGPFAKETPQAPRLPLDVWQHICSFLEPVSLGRLICVNRALNALLDPQKPIPEHMKKNNRTQNDIWSASRKRLLPGFPRPLSWISELTTWRLLLGTFCQFCERKPGKPSTMTQSPWTSGPGQEGVRIIWPFAVRSCGKCLTTRITKDADLRFSDVSILLPGLPYAYFTSELSFVTSVALRATSPPLGLDLTRYYSQSQVDQIKKERDHAISLGRPAAEEWVKGIDDIGRQKMEDSKRFELWEATGGLQALLQSRSKHAPPPRHSLPAKPALPALSLPSLPTHVQTSSYSAGSQTESPLSAQYKPSPPGINHLSGFNTPHLPFRPASPAPGQQSVTHPQSGNSFIHSQGPRGRPERSVGEVNQRKAERRAEIERRCLQLDPPIKATTLPYMDAFNNAMQIPMALNDNAWDVLKPRLIAQHSVAQRKEEDSIARNQLSRPQTDQRRENEEQLRHAQTLLERQHDDIQRPVREKLAAYADELINSDWNGGAGVVKDNAPQFAADLLIYVRRKFFEALDDIDKLPQAQGSLTPSNSVEGNANRHLTLEDMKWVYETKIKPITQRYTKEIFLCGACDVDRKHYALDAVIQHYAAKHTHHFSHGTAVVYWKADWPLQPPFDAKPIRSPRNRPIDHNGVSPMYERDFGRPQHADPIAVLPEQTYLARSGVMMTPDVAPPPLARYAASAYSVDEEVYHARGRLVPTQPMIPGPAMYANGPGYKTYYVPVSPASPAFSARGLAAGHYRGHPIEVYQSPYPVNRYDPSTMSPAGQNGYDSQPLQVFQGSRIDHRAFPQPGQPAGFHQTQVAELARNARKIWDDTGGIDDLPDSVRIYVIIHHVVLRFHQKYTNEPTLALFTDALLNSSHMRPLKALDGLVCKSCTTQDNTITRADHVSPEYKLPDLLKHFQSTHVESVIPSATPYTGLDLLRPDWKFDMVQLPDERTIKRLVRSPGMTDSKLNLIAIVLSRYFDYPIPRLDREPQGFRPGVSIPSTDETTRPLIRHSSSSIPRDDAQDYIPLDEYETALERPPASTTQDRQRAGSVAESPREDEYDPLRPAAIRSILGYGNGFERPRSSLREPQEPHYAYADRGAPPASQRLLSAASPRRRFYDDDRYGSPHAQDLVPRRRYVGDEHDVHMQYGLIPSQYPHRPIRDRDLGFGSDWESERAQDPVQQVTVGEERVSPSDFTTGATQFLRNFNVDSDPDESSLPDRVSNNASSNRTGRNPAGSRHLRDQPGTGVVSRKSTPRKPISGRGASARSRSPSTSRDAPRFSEAQPSFRPPENAAFDREPPQQAQYADPRYLERPIYEDDLVPQHYVVSRYRTRSPGLNQQHVALRHVEARPLPRDRYSDDDFYEQPGREYVQVMPRGVHAPQQLERRVVQNNFSEYVEHGGAYGHIVDARDDQAYNRLEAPPPPPPPPPPARREVRYDIDPYDERRRYQ